MADVLKSYLVSLGFHVDPQVEKMFMTSMRTAVIQGDLLVKTLEAAGKKIIEALADIGEGQTELGRLSERLKVPIKELQAFQLLMEKNGITAQETTNLLISMSNKFKTAPGVKQMFARYNIDMSQSLIGILRDFSKAQERDKNLPESSKMIEWQELGLSETMRLAFQRSSPEFDKFMKEHVDLYKKMGGPDPDDPRVKADWEKLSSSWIEVKSTTNKLLVQIASTFAEPAGEVMDWFGNWLADNAAGIKDVITASLGPLAKFFAQKAGDAAVAFAENAPDWVQEIVASTVFQGKAAIFFGSIGAIIGFAFGGPLGAGLGFGIGGVAYSGGMLFLVAANQLVKTIRENWSAWEKHIIGLETLRDIWGVITHPIDAITRGLKSAEMVLRRMRDGVMNSAFLRWMFGLDNSAAARAGAAAGAAIGAGAMGNRDELQGSQEANRPVAENPNSMPGEIAAMDPMAPAGSTPDSANTEEITTSAGLKFRIKSEFAENAREFIRRYEEAGGEIGSIGGLGARPNNPSYHPDARAFDVNQIGYGVRDSRYKSLPEDVEDRIALETGFYSGNMFISRNDRGHFEIRNRKYAALKRQQWAEERRRAAEARDQHETQRRREAWGNTARPAIPFGTAPLGQGNVFRPQQPQSEGQGAAQRGARVEGSLTVNLQLPNANAAQVAEMVAKKQGNFYEGLGETFFRSTTRAVA